MAAWVRAWEQKTESWDWEQMYQRRRTFDSLPPLRPAQNPHSVSTVFVDNVDAESEEDAETVVSLLRKICGISVTSVRLLRRADGRFKGQLVLTMRDPADASIADRAGNGASKCAA